MPRYQKQDLTGQRFGMLTILGFSRTSPDGRYRYWNCRCDCGGPSCEKEASGQMLSSGHVRNCGCVRKYKEYNTWHKMTRRCTDPNDPAWPYYGGRGITVCDRWLEDFLNFYKDMGPRPPDAKEHLSIERVDNNGNYCPENCKWETRKNQSRNNRRNQKITYNGKTMVVADWAEPSGIPTYILYKRKAMKWPDDVILTVPWKERTGALRFPKKIED